MSRVRVGTCSGPAHAALVRAAFEAHDIPVFINAEQHASILGGMGGVFVPLHVYVAGEHAEQAAELLRDLEQQHAADLDEAAGTDDDDDPEAADVEVRVDRRRRTGVVLLLALCITFGTAHMYTGAWLRGIGLAALELYAFKLIASGASTGSILLVACIVTDLAGALFDLRAQRTRLPRAQAR